MKKSRVKSAPPIKLQLTSLMDMFTIILVFLLMSLSSEDYDFFLRAAAAGVRFGKHPEVLMRWRDHPDRHSRNAEAFSLPMMRESRSSCSAAVASCVSGLIGGMCVSVPLLSVSRV